MGLFHPLISCLAYLKSFSAATNQVSLNTAVLHFARHSWEVLLQGCCTTVDERLLEARNRMIIIIIIISLLARTNLTFPKDFLEMSQFGHHQCVYKADPNRIGDAPYTFFRASCSSFPSEREGHPEDVSILTQL